MQLSGKWIEDCLLCLKAMRHLLIAASASALLIAPALAEPPEGGAPQQSFEQVKQHRLARIDAMRACVAKANTFEQLDACRPKRKQRHEGAKPAP